MGEGTMKARWRAALTSAAIAAVMAVTPALAVPATAAPLQVTAGNAATSLPALMPMASPTKITFRTNTKTLRINESVRLSGKVTTKGGKGVRTTVRLQYRAKGGKFSTFRTVSTSSSGAYVQYHRPTKSGDYRVVVSSNTSVKSKAIAVKRSKANRSIVSRTKSLGSLATGKATSGTKTLSAAARKKVGLSGVSRVRYRNFSKGMLVEVKRNGTTATWFVHGKTATAYRKAGGPGGSWGIPVVDAKCSLMENGCVQRFSKRTVYTNANKKAVSVVTAKGKTGEIVAAGASQVGYRKRYSNSSVQYTKFNNWAGSTKPWCAMYLSWASYASGNGDTIPIIPTFVTFKSEMAKRYKTGKKPKVGAVVILNGSGFQTHAAIVTGVSGKRVRIMDGNTGYSSPGGYRGVSERWVSASSLGYFIYLT
ncbi:CHAP domain-containing protein [Jonesia quinghaiensis]|uniref:CHAP domain-containing protein n=1 Tax=Jonesia quinghaiensis TaxID=262806 RepID=UPI00041D38A3|nr:CHAP domain-containing protein [Jonesia quinghaiensis]